MKLIMKMAGATKVRKPSAWPFGTPMRIRNRPGEGLRRSVSAAVATATMPTTIRAMWTWKGKWRGLGPYWAAMPARPGPRPKPSRKKTPASAAASALLDARAWSTTKAVPTPRKPPIASPCSTRPANSRGTDSANEKTSEARVMIAIAGSSRRLRPRRSLRLPAISMVGTTVTV